MNTNRRSFLMASGLTALAATRAFGANDRVRAGLIGCGARSQRLLHAADEAGGYELVVACDVYQPRRDAAEGTHGADFVTCLDYRDVLAKNDIDAVIIAAPDHWHVKMACDAIAAGKDVYVEKPVTHTMDQGETLTRAVRGSKRVLQCGMQQRSWVHFQSAVELIQSGNIGRITQVRTYWFQTYHARAKTKPIEVDKLDWKQWLGSAPDQPYAQDKYWLWRWYWDFGGGAMTDLFAHWIDVVHWAMKSPEPQVVQGMGDRYVFDWECPDTVQVALRYPGFEVGYEGTMVSSIDDGGLEFRGTNGTLKINRAGFAIYREGVKDNPILSERSALDGTISHMANFFDCVRDRKEPNAPVETGVAAARAAHIANMALRSGNRVTWPPAGKSA